MASRKRKTPSQAMSGEEKKISSAGRPREARRAASEERFLPHVYHHGHLVLHPRLLLPQPRVSLE